MSHSTAINPVAESNGHGHAHGHEPAYIAARRELDLSQVTFEPRWSASISVALWLAGVVSIIVLVAVAMVSGDAQTTTHALGAYHLGVLYAVGIGLGALGSLMIQHQFNSGWSGALRRQAETIVSQLWVVAVLFMPVVILDVFILHGHLFKWMDPAHTAGDVIYERKAAFLNPGFWMVRSAIYFAIWIVFGLKLYQLSREQDRTGDKTLTARARFLSSFGLLIYALTTAFASFDWIMSLDYHWFSTMFGVVFFAGNVISSSAMIIVILTTLRIKGKMGPTFTSEHQHDLGKILFAFTVFWAYVSLSQYFLIWYGNVPEETAFYNIRKTGPYNALTWAICFGHFAVPFLLLLVRDFKRNAHTLRLIALWMLIMHGVDLAFLVSPVINPPVNVDGVMHLQKPWLEIFGILGPVCLFMGFVVSRMAAAPLIPIKDPRLDEVLAHKNYV